MKPILRSVLLVLAVLILIPTVFAQVKTGGMTGTVTDVTGGVMPGVEVSIRNQETNVVRTAITNDQGRYTVTNLNSGIYEVRFELTGFKRLVSADNQITVGKIDTLNATLELGDITETLTVTSLSTAVNTVDSQPSTLVNSEQIVDLPLNGRNVYALALVAPGVVPAMDSVAQTSGAAGSSFMAAGTRARGNNFTLDGAHNTNDGISGQPTVTPSVDSVQEFRLIRNNFSAEYGSHSGSVVNVVTKSGTNQYHGTAYYFHRNDAFDAADVFAHYDETTGEKDKSPLKWHQFGFSFGGPIVKDKLFFFGGYEGFRETRGQTDQTRVETPEFRQYVSQNFPGSAAAQIFSEIPAQAPTSEIETVQDIIDADAGWCYYCDLSQWPADLPVIGLASASGADTDNSNQYYLRIDYAASEKLQLFGRFDTNSGNQTDLFFARPNGGGDLINYDQMSVNISATYSFTPTTLNEFRFGYISGTTDFLVETPHIPMNYFTGGYGSVSNTIGGFLGEPQLFTRDTMQFSDIVSFNIGDHFLRAGGDIRLPKEDSDFGNTTRPLLLYSGLFDMAMDSPYYISAGIDPRDGTLVGTPRNFESTELGFFIQDDWKVSSRLTLNLGIRWDYFGPTTEANGALSGMTFPTGDDYYERVSTAVVGPVDQLYNKDMNNFAPRFGFAWDLFGDGSTSLRGGYGVSYDKIFFNVGANSRFNPPFFGLAALSDVFFGDDTSEFPLLGPGGDIFGGFRGIKVADAFGFDEFGGVEGQRLNLRVLDPNIRDTYVHNMFLGIQRELPWEMVLEVNVQATYGKKLGFIGNPNRFNGDLIGWPNVYGDFEGSNSLDRYHQSFHSFNLRQNRITSNYHGFNLQLAKRMTQGLSFQFAYTMGHSLDHNSDVFGSGGNDTGSDIFFSDPLNVRLDYGRSNFDVRQRFVSNFLWEIPYRRDQEGVLGQILGGWQVTGTFPIQTGLPFSAYTTSRSADYNKDGTRNDRPDAPSYGHDLGSPTTSDWIAGVMEGDDFPIPEDGYNGTIGKNVYQGPNFWTVDMGLFKSFALPMISEESRLQFRAEFFNLFNRVNLYLPTARLNSTFFGKSNTSFAPREIQLALKFIF